MKSLDIGDTCVYCWNDTKRGSGKFVNRHPADSIWKITTMNGYGETDKVLVMGYACQDCQQLPCDGCGERTLDYTLENNQAMCEKCTEGK